MFEDISNVAAQVHCDTITAAVSPIPTFRPAVLKCSDDILLPKCFSSYWVNNIVKMVKKIPNLAWVNPQQAPQLGRCTLRHSMKHSDVIRDCFPKM